MLTNPLHSLAVLPAALYCPGPLRRCCVLGGAVNFSGNIDKRRPCPNVCTICCAASTIAAAAASRFECIDRLVQGLSALFLALRRRPVIRYQKGSNAAQRLAEGLYALTYKQQVGLFSTCCHADLKLCRLCVHWSVSKCEDMPRSCTGCCATGPCYGYRCLKQRQAGPRAEGLSYCNAGLCCASGVCAGWRV